eukprot:3654458-Amphidinium_carterae.1
MREVYGFRFHDEDGRDTFGMCLAMFVEDAKVACARKIQRSAATVVCHIAENIPPVLCVWRGCLHEPTRRLHGDHEL